MLAAGLLTLSLPSAGLAVDPQPNIPVPDVSALALGEGEGATPDVAPDLARASGPVKVVVRLADPPLAVAVGQNARQHGSALNPAGQKAYVAGLAKKQDALLTRIDALGGKRLGQVTRALDAVIVEVDASRIAEIAALPNVASIRPLVDYQLDLSETVPYIGATTVQGSGFDGTGVRVAVLDSGIDYTHYNLGGPGTAEAYFAAYGTSTTDPKNTSRDGLFPTAKVVDGYDFVGERWDGSATTPPLAPDPDPIDCGPTAIGCGGGHGTHVADIIAGKSADGLHKGVAPGASLVAVKVCSSQSTACSGIALLEGMDFALDPNGDGSISDAVDVVNMSLGSSYGQRQDDLSAASANAVRMGVVVVASAGNAADRPYIVGSPSSTPEVISVAQTQVPSAIAYPLVINSPASIAGVYANTATVDWAPIDAGFTGDVVYVGRACPGDTLLANPAGKVALVDRGVCAISLKTDTVAKAGAIGMLLGLVASGDAVSFSYGGGTDMVPTLVIIQGYANLIKANIAAPVNVTVSPSNGIALVGSMVGSSSRGPSFSYNAIKPDIGAPGGSVSAVAGSGTGVEAFSGTSGAAPMVTGSAALLVDKYGTSRTPAEVKALLMNTAETDILTNPATLPGVLAPITRIGGGEVRVDRAAGTATAAWDATALTGSLSFGYQALTGSAAFQKTVVVRNYSSNARTYAITPSFRYADDAASGAVAISAPAMVKVAANGSATFNVKVKVDVNKLPIWDLNGGARGGDGYRLESFEYDGYVTIADATDAIHLAWQILPHRSAAVTPASTSVTLAGGTATLALSNATGAVDGRVEVFSLLGTSGRIPPPTLPKDGDNYAVIDLKSFGVRWAGTAIQFAVDTFGTRAHPNYPAEFDVYLDTNRDGTSDYVIYNLENGGFGATGQNVVAVVKLATGTGAIYYYTDADLDSSTAILTAPLAALGLTTSTQFDVSVYACDNYFSGACTDAITGMTYTVGVPRYYPDSYTPVVPAGGSSTLGIHALPGGDTASPSQQGLLLVYRDAREQRQADAIFVNP
jgi:subtilisin family serine protease